VTGTASVEVAGNRGAQPSASTGDRAGRLDREPNTAAASQRPLANQAEELQRLRLLVDGQTERAIASEQARIDAAHAHALTKRRLRRVEAHVRELDSKYRQLYETHLAVLSSTAWLATWPLRRLGGATPPGIRRIVRVVAHLVWWSITLQLRSKLRDRRLRRAATAQHALSAPTEDRAIPVPEPAHAENDSIPTARNSVEVRFPALERLRTYPELRSGRRLSIVTDSVSPGLLYGGVGTAILFGTLLAKRIGADLRLITRYEAPDAGQLGLMLATHGIEFRRPIDCVFSPWGAGASVPTFDGDLFLTTSWWTTKATRMAIPPRKIIYLLQEDERMFYPRGDERLRCGEVLAAQDLQFVVNSEMLLRHFAEGNEPLQNIVQQGCWFDPAFRANHYYDDAEGRKRRTKKNLLFYARPNNLRNLYWRGLETLSGAIEDGVLSPEAWNFIFIGRDLKRISLPGGVYPTIRENLPWLEYAALVREIDVGLSLIDTPHPSYPPLDLAASGAVVVTNTCGLKRSLARYSENIVCVDPTVEGLKQRIRQAVAIASNEPLRVANHARNAITRDWSLAFEPALQRCAALAT
jgi:hypothetical protein